MSIITTGSREVYDRHDSHGSSHLKFKQFAERRLTGTYVSCSFMSDSRFDLATWCVENLIPVPLAPSKYHTTILYSRSHVNDVEKIVEKMDDSLRFKIKGFHLFDTEDQLLRSLVLELDAPELIVFHDRLIKAGGTHDYPTFTPHLTVSYSVPIDMNLKVLKLP